MTNKAKNILFVAIWAVLLLLFAASFFAIGFELFTHDQGINSYLIIVAGLGAFFSFCVGFFSYIMISPWLLKKHQVHNFVESYVCLNFIFSEIELKKIYKSTKDVSVGKTINLIKFSKVGLVTFIILLVLLIIMS